MIRHIVMWKFREGTEEKANEFLTKLAALDGVIPQLKKSEVARNIFGFDDEQARVIAGSIDAAGGPLRIVGGRAGSGGQVGAGLSLACPFVEGRSGRGGFTRCRRCVGIGFRVGIGVGRQHAFDRLPLGLVGAVRRQPGVARL